MMTSEEYITNMSNTCQHLTKTRNTWWAVNHVLIAHNRYLFLMLIMCCLCLLNFSAVCYNTLFTAQHGWLIVHHVLLMFVICCSLFMVCCWCSLYVAYCSSCISYSNSVFWLLLSSCCSVQYNYHSCFSYRLDS